MVLEQECLLLQVEQCLQKEDLKEDMNYVFATRNNCPTFLFFVCSAMILMAYMIDICKDNS